MSRTLFFSPFLLTFALAAAPALAQETAPAAAPSAQEAQTLVQDLARRVEKLESAPAKAGLNSFNPAIGMAIDGAFRDSNDKAAFQFRAAELNVEAPVDPHLKAWAVITGSNGGVDVEEATLETTSLPYNLTVRGGRLFANFGRMAHFHDHELPVVDRPRSLDTYVGGEAQADGVETQWLVPAPFYLNATAGAYNKMGADNARQGNQGQRPLDQFTYLGRVNTYADLTDDQSVELGADSAWTPKRSVADTAGPGGAATGIVTRSGAWRTLSGVDLTYRYQPAQGGLYKGVTWGTEVLRNDERRFDPVTNLPTGRVQAYAGYSYVEVKGGLRLRGGVMVDLTEDQDIAGKLTSTYTGFLTYDVSEFQRLRLTYAEAITNVAGTPRDRTLALQWTGVIGHHVHGFRDR